MILKWYNLIVEWVGRGYYSYISASGNKTAKENGEPANRLKPGKEGFCEGVALTAWATDLDDGEK